MSVRSEYGFTQAEYDHALFYNKRRFELVWTGTGTVDNSPAVNLYLERENTSIQGLYVPTNTYAGVRFHAFVYDATNGTFITSSSGISTINRGTGNVAVTNHTLPPSGTVGGGNFTITPTANTTVQAIEFVCADSDSEQSVVVILHMEVLVYHTLAVGQSRITNGKTSALTVAE